MVRHLCGETFLILLSMKKDLFPEIEMHKSIFFKSPQRMKVNSNLNYSPFLSN